jgi:hypothetical protein
VKKRSRNFLSIDSGNATTFIGLQRQNGQKISSRMILTQPSSGVKISLCYLFVTQHISITNGNG